jgi:hypothetical protein
MLDGQAYPVPRLAMAIAESMEEPNWMEIGVLRGWRSALVRVVAIVREMSYLGWLGGFAAKNENSNAVSCRGQRHRLGRHGRVNSIRAGIRS